MQHISFIMDGNRTWAKERGLPSFEGHRNGYENAKKIIRFIQSKGVPFVSLWALSDDNIRTRDQAEVNYLFDLLTVGIFEIAKEAKEDGNRIVVVGDRTLLPQKCQNTIKNAEEMTQDETGTTVIIAIGYGGQEEIIRAIRRASDAGVDMRSITQESLNQYIETAVYPPPDMIVRTGGHIRHSGFFLYQSPYAEYFFSPKNWPDFSTEDVEEVLEDFKKRERKYGK